MAMSTSLNEQLIIATLFHDIGKTVDIKKHYEVPLLDEFPSPIKDIIKKHHDRSPDVTLENLMKEAKNNPKLFLSRILTASDRIASEVEKADVGKEKKMFLNYPLTVNPLSGCIEDKEKPQFDEQKLKECIKEVCNNFNGFINGMLKTTLSLNGEERLRYFLSLLKNYPNDTRYPSNDTSLLSHTLTAMVIANFLYNASISQDYRLSCIVCEISADDWLSRISRTNEFNSKEKYLHKSLTQILLKFSETADIDMHPLTTMMIPTLVDGKELHVVMPWIFVTCESLREKFLNSFMKVFLEVCKAQDLLDVLKFRIFSVSESESVATCGTSLKDIVENGKERLLALIKEALEEKGKSEYTYRTYSLAEETLLTPGVYHYDNAVKLGETRLCEYCGRRPGITDEKLRRIACSRCKKIVESERGVSIDDISDDDRLIAVVGFKISGLRDILLKAESHVALGSPFNIAGKELDWFPGRMCERIHELCGIGESLKEILRQNLDTLIQNGFIGNKYNINISGEIVDGTMVKDMCGSLLKIEFDETTRACWLKDCDEKKVILNVFGLTDKDKDRIVKCNKAILRNEKEDYLQVMTVSKPDAVKPEYRVWKIVNRLNLQNDSLIIAYIIPAEFAFNALSEIYNVLRKYGIDDRVGIEGILTKVESEDYPLYMLIEEALRVT